jgi:hypothetical protein
MTRRRPSEVLDANHFHAVRFYKDSRELCDIVAKFIIEGLHAGQPAVAIITTEHRGTLLDLLDERGAAVETILDNGTLRLFDAEATLAEFMSGGSPDPALFRHAVQPVLASAAKARPGAVVRAYGEMVNILWQRGLGSAATRLETLWNDLARTENFALLCGYSMGHFYKDSDIEKICSQHSYVVDTAARFPTVIAH